MDNVVYADCVLINGKVATVDAHFSFKRHRREAGMDY